MDTATLVNNQIDDGKKLVKHLRSAGVDVQVAFWALTTDEGIWHLFIASPLVDKVGLAEAYQKVYSELRSIHVQWIVRSDIKLISDKSPIACDAFAYQDTTLETKFGGRKLGKLIIDEALIYPSS